MTTPAEPVDAGLPFRPESAEHFKELAKSLAWLFALPLQETQECLSRIYGYENLHELQANLQKPGEPGVWGAVERKTGLGACHCKMIGIPASKAGQFMKRKKSYAKPRRASVAD